MAIDPSFYLHKSDRLALDALKAIPGFTPLLKAFMKIWSEKQFRIQNMSTNLRISEKQLPKYYNMLPPICEKLGIDIPELYLELDVRPNAYTAGDTKPFIVMTSGLLETLPEELIPTVLAHECGHIACQHVLYSTMGRIILSEAVQLLGLSDIAVLPIQVAFYYWMRCSELSADRAAAICDGSSRRVVDMCMRFAGFDKDIDGEANVDEFMNQALEYKQMVQDSTWNKTLEFVMFSQETHPLTAVRAYECAEWTSTDTFAKICEYLSHPISNSSVTTLGAYLGELPLQYSSRYFLGRNYQEVFDTFTSIGFTNVQLMKETSKTFMTRDDQVIAITINHQDKFERGDWYPIDSEILITYYQAETEAEVAAAHPGQLRVPESSKKCIGKNLQEITAKFAAAGFTVMMAEGIERTKRDWLVQEGSIAKISINGQTQFAKDEWFDEKAVIRITYYLASTDKQ